MSIVTIGCSNCVNYSSKEYLEYDDGLEEVVRDQPGLNSAFIVHADSKGMFLNTDNSKKIYENRYL